MKSGLIAELILMAGAGLFVLTYKSILPLFGVSMAGKTTVDIKLENFDDVWGLGYPVEIEKKFRELLPQAEALADKSIYLQMLSQIALAQALQQNFDEAHKTLDDAQKMLTLAYNLAQVRVLLERGRVFQQAGKIPNARDYFEQSYALSEQNKFDAHTINAAHMIAIVAEDTGDKIKWNQLGLDLATTTQDKKAHLWLGSLYNNLGQNYIDAQEYAKALDAYQKALECRELEGYAPNVRVAKWAIARALRLLDRSDDALVILLPLAKDYDAVSSSENYEMPVEMFKYARGLVYGELAEAYQAKARSFAKLAYDDLSNDPMLMQMEPARIERMKHMQDLD